VETPAPLAAAPEIVTMLSRLLVALGFPSSAQVDLPRSECVFCRIADGNHGDSKTVLFQNDRIVVFPDASPGGAEHLQVCSRAHIQSVDSLVPGSAHHALGEASCFARKLLGQLTPKPSGSRRAAAPAAAAVEEMLRVGREVCERRRPGAPAKFGFHVPPFTSVCHLQ
jgi:hypothetical protein